MLGIYVAGDSGAYLNPAITLTNCIFRQLPWRRFPVYLTAQLLGGFVGSGIVYANYISAIDYFEGGLRTVPPAPKATAAIFCTYPQPFLTKTSQFFSEFIASALLIFVIFALKDPSNNGVPKVWHKQHESRNGLTIVAERQVVPPMSILPHFWTGVVFWLGDRVCDQYCS
jgi:aquaglyceroporin related protein